MCWFSSFEWLDIYMHKAALPPSSGKAMPYHWRARIFMEATPPDEGRPSLKWI
jgi:hypothetical protein